MSDLAFTIWLIGWLFACGVHYDSCEKQGIGWQWRFAGYLFFIVLWPHYLGGAWFHKG